MIPSLVEIMKRIQGHRLRPARNITFCILFSLFATTAAANPCYDDYLKLEALYQQHNQEKIGIDIDHFISLARATRACYLAVNSDPPEIWDENIHAHIQAWIAIWECTFLTIRRRDSECLDLTDDHIRWFGDITDSFAMTWLYARRGQSSSRLARHADTIANFSKAVQLGVDLDLEHRLDHLLHAGIAYRRLNDNASAGRVYEHVMRIAKPHIHAKASIEIAYARAAYRLSRVKLHYVGRGERLSMSVYEEGIALLDTAIPIIERYGPQTELVYGREAQFRFALAIEDLAAAAFHLKQAEKAAAGLNYMDVEEALLTCRADLAWRQGNFARAVVIAEEAIELVEPAPVYVRRRDLYNRLGTWTETIGNRSAAVEWFQRSIRETEQGRAELGSSDWSLIAFSEQQFPYRNLARLYLKDGDPEQAMHILELGRARYLQDGRYLSRMRGAMSGNESLELAQIEADLLEVRARLPVPDLSDEEFLELQREEYLLTWRRSHILQPDTALFVPQLHQLQQRLAGENRYLITYLLGDEDDSNPSSAIVVGPDQIYAVPLSSSQFDIEDLIANLRPDEDAREINLRTLYELYLSLIDPLLHLVPAGAPITVVPDGPLQQLPFGMLVTEPAAMHDYRSARYLIRRNPLSSELSAALLLEQTEDADFRHDILALGRSEFGSKDVSSDGSRVRHSRYASTNLPYVEQELASLRRLVGNGLFAMNEAATVQQLKEHMASSRIIHLATHSVVNPTSSGHSFVQLHPGEDVLSEETGTFFIYELEGHYLPSELVVLSACETALGRHFDGEGMIGVQYAFRAAGASATLATMWAVDDRAIAYLMEQFYRNLRKGLPKDRALQQAQLAYLDMHDGLLANPFFWASPIIYGNPESVHLGARSLLAFNLFTLAIVLGFALTLVCIVIVRLRKRVNRKLQTNLNP